MWKMLVPFSIRCVAKKCLKGVQVHFTIINSVLHQKLSQFSSDCIFADSDCAVLLIVEKNGMRPEYIHIRSQQLNGLVPKDRIPVASVLPISHEYLFPIEFYILHGQAS
jgi:hypothetical protein